MRKHISFTRHDPRLGKRFASKNSSREMCVLPRPKHKGSAVDGQCPLKKFFIIACCKAESNWVFDIYKTKGVYRFSLDLLLPNSGSQATRILRPFFLVAGRMRFTSLVPKAFPKSKSSRFLRREWLKPGMRHKNGCTLPKFNMVHLKMAPKGIGDSGDSFRKPSCLGFKLHLGSAFASQKSRA